MFALLGVLKNAFILAIDGLKWWVNRIIFNSGRIFERSKQQDETIKGHDEANKAREEWKSSGGLGGAVNRMPPKDSD